MIYNKIYLYNIYIFWFLTRRLSPDRYQLSWVGTAATSAAEHATASDINLLWSQFAALTPMCPSPVVLLSMSTLTSPRFSPFVLGTPLILLLLFPNCRWLPPPVWFAGLRVPNAIKNNKVAASLRVPITSRQSVR